MNLDHVFIDIGLSSTGIVTGLAAVRTDRKAKPLAAYSEGITEGRGYNDKLDNALENMFSVVLKPYPADYVIVSQHAGRYRSVIDAYVQGRPWLDIAQLAWPLGFSDMIPNRDLDTLCKHFGMKPDDGTISGNCESVVRVYWAMMKRYRTALIGEEAVRDFGGETLASLRKYIGV